MKATVFVIVATVILSFILSLLYYIASGGTHASSDVTSILVGISLALVLFSKWLWKLIQTVFKEKT